MTLNLSRAVQRVMNNLADEGVAIERGTVKRSVEKAMTADSAIVSEDEIVEWVTSAITDASEYDLLGESISEEDAGGIFLTGEDNNLDIDDI